jgi:molecular chaperone DnaJ
MAATKRDPYDVLGVPRDADEQQIKKSFRKLARELHPDVNRHDPQAEEKFKEAAEAYEILSDSERRAIFDRYGHEGLGARGFESGFGGFGSFADIFDAFFGGGDAFGGAFGGAAGGPVQGGDIAVAVEVSLLDAAHGTQASVEYDAVDTCEHCRGNGAEPGTPIETCERCGGSGQLRSVSRTAFGQLVRSHVCDACGGDGKIAREPCRECEGRGRVAGRRTLDVDIPAGIADEQRIRITGRGHAGDRGGPAGDLYVLVRVTPDERFVRDGNDLVTVIDLPAPQAALGARVTVPTLDGEEELEIEPGTQPGSVITMRGKGMPSLRRGRRGDQRVVVNVMIPRKLSSEQRELLERFAATIGDENLHEGGDESLFARVRRALS